MYATTTDTTITIREKYKESTSAVILSLIDEAIKFPLINGYIADWNNVANL
jgi:hypothetical protein